MSRKFANFAQNLRRLIERACLGLYLIGTNSITYDT